MNREPVNERAKGTGRRVREKEGEESNLCASEG